MTHASPAAAGRGMGDRALWDIDLGLVGRTAVLVAYDLKLFALLGERPCTIEEVGAALGIARRPAEALLRVCLSLGFIQVADGRFALSALSRAYLLKDSPTYFGGFFDFLIANHPMFSFDNLKRAVLTNSPQAYGGGDIFKSHKEQAQLARAFTRCMHTVSRAPAQTWPDALDLSACRLMLDVGGGSGAHAIAAVARWPGLRAVVFDIPTVCEVVPEFAAQHGMQERIATRAGDMWSDPFPEADLHFYSQIFHDWPPEKCAFLARKSFDALERGGRIVIHEILYDNDKAGPPAAAAFSAVMLLSTEGEQYSGRELSAMLAGAGFVDLAVTPTFGDWSIVVGRKP